MYQWKIALRSLLYRKSQYVSLFLVCLFGVAISLGAIAVSTGMIFSLNQKARIYYGGEIALMCSEGHGLAINNYQEKYEIVKSFFDDDAVVVPRLDFDARHSSFYFEGVQALQQTIKGVNFEAERALLGTFNFVEGGLDAVAEKNAVFISAPIAKMLGCVLGDEITFQLQTVEGYLNTMPVVVRGIFHDSSVFGMYTSYMDFEFLKEAYGRPAHFANRICIHFPTHSTLTDAEYHKIYDKLATKLNMYPYVTDKDDYIDADDTFTTETWGFIPLSANLNDVKIMEVAMTAVISFIIVMLTLIIIAGIGSTYRVLIMKRINEIGVYMALGMKKRAIIATLLSESFVLLVFGCLAGIILSVLLCGAISTVNFSFIPSFDLFLFKGNLVPRVDVIKSVLVIVSVIVVTLLAVLYSTLKSIKIMPVAALATTE